MTFCVFFLGIAAQRMASFLLCILLSENRVDNKTKKVSSSLSFYALRIPQAHLHDRGKGLAACEPLAQKWHVGWQSPRQLQKWCEANTNTNTNSAAAVEAQLAENRTTNCLYVSGDQCFTLACTQIQPLFTLKHIVEYCPITAAKDKNDTFLSEKCSKVNPFSLQFMSAVIKRKTKKEK